MRVFVTGATGWVGSEVVKDLVAAGHHVTGLVRPDGQSTPSPILGMEAVYGDLDDLDTLRSAAAAADAVIHTAFNHDFSKFAQSAAQDQTSIECLGSALEGSDRPLIVTSPIALVDPGRVVTELDQPSPAIASPRKSEVTARALAGRGVHAVTVRLAPSVHGVGDRGFIRILIGIAREKGVSAYVGDTGANRWPGVHRSDVGRLYRQVLEQGASDDAYHAVAEEGVPFKKIAEVIGHQLGLPVESRGREHFGWFGGFASADMPASSALTRSRLGWTPSGPDLLTDLNQPGYYTA